MTAVVAAEPGSPPTPVDAMSAAYSADDGHLPRGVASSKQCAGRSNLDHAWPVFPGIPDGRKQNWAALMSRTPPGRRTVLWWPRTNLSGYLHELRYASCRPLKFKRSCQRYGQADRRTQFLRKVEREAISRLRFADIAFQGPRADSSTNRQRRRRVKSVLRDCLTVCGSASLTAILSTTA